MPWGDGTRPWRMGSRMNRAAVIPAGSGRRNRCRSLEGCCLSPGCGPTAGRARVQKQSFFHFPVFSELYCVSGSQRTASLAQSLLQPTDRLLSSAVSWPNDGGIKPTQRLCRSFYALIISFHEVKATNHGIKLLDSRDLLSVPDGIDDSGVGTAGDDG